ncbi:MAG TPA: SMC-Scp complex subunit ScpB [Syntrophorhabdales bacterium]|nr:SMC-Scp complex subunit ScpB [Syntrophorhabdales bacterium]
MVLQGERYLLVRVPRGQGKNNGGGETISTTELKNILEAILFSSAKPVGARKLHKGLQEYSAEEIAGAAKSLMEEYRDANRSVEIVEVAGGYQMRTKIAYRDHVRRFVKEREGGLTRPMLETLAIIAYRQPVAKRDIDGLRGVDSARTIRQLLDRKVIEIAGRNEELGKPIIFRTTARFLELFGLKDIRDLPTIREIESLEK